MNEKLRKCEVELRDSMNQRYKKTGYFHTWGNEQRFCNDIECAIAIGVVELESGEVYTVEPYNIKFIDDSPEMKRVKI